MKKYLLIIIMIIGISNAQKILIPMDDTQKDHLKSYGLTFFILKKNMNVDWLLNFKGGAFLVDDNEIILNECLLTKNCKL